MGLVCRQVRRRDRVPYSTGAAEHIRRYFQPLVPATPFLRRIARITLVHAQRIDHGLGLVAQGYGIEGIQTTLLAVDATYHDLVLRRENRAPCTLRLLPK